MNTRNTTNDHRAIREINDLIASLTQWKASIAHVGYDQHYAVDDKVACLDAAATLFECDALTELADEDREINAAMDRTPSFNAATGSWAVRS